MLAQKQKLAPIGINQKIDYKDIDLLKLFINLDIYLRVCLKYDYS